MLSTDATVRSPAVAGAFYPGEPDELARMIDGFLERATTPPLTVKAIVAPHAGYVYSGPIAANAYAAIRHAAPVVRRVVLLGPAHRFRLRGVAAPSAAAFRTPLGDLPVDRAGVARALAVPGVAMLDHAFDGEHALEVQLPFLQRLLPDAAIVPLLVGDAPPALIESILDETWGGPETLIVVSSDLSHYRDSATARVLDLATSQAIETLAEDQLSSARACGALPIAGLLRRARALDLRLTVRDLRHSGDTAGDNFRVVGYGAYTAEPAESAALSEPERAALLGAARKAVAHVVATGKQPAVRVESFPWPLRAMRRTFVTLELDGRLRGCIGTVAEGRPLIADVIANACRSAVEDPRFPPMTAREAERASLSISILSHDRPLPFSDNADLIRQLRPGHDGLILRDHNRSALFLPKVWDTIPDSENFVANLKIKAGLPPGYQSPTLRATRFVAESF